MEVVRIVVLDSNHKRADILWFISVGVGPGVGDSNRESVLTRPIYRRMAMIAQCASWRLR